MLSTIPAKKPAWPEMKPKAEDQVRLINVSGSQSRSSFIPRHNKSDSEPECEDYIPAPTFNRSFSDAITMAFEKAASSNVGNNGMLIPYILFICF